MFGARLNYKIRKYVLFVVIACLLSTILVPGAALSAGARNSKAEFELPSASLRSTLAIHPGPAGSLLLHNLKAAEGKSAKQSISPQSSGFNESIQDSTDPSKVFLFNSSTGAFQFSQCDLKPPVFFQGTGTVTTIGSLLNLQYNAGGNKVTAQVNTGTLTGTATVTLTISQGVFQTYTLKDSNVSKDTTSNTPVVQVTSPAGGETVDAGSILSVAWSVSDSVNILSQDIQYSTNGGSTYTNAVTGLSGTIRQYNWTVPSIANNQNVKVQVIAHNASCNPGGGASSSTFTIWNPSKAYSFQSESPAYKIGNGYTSTIYLANPSSASVDVELLAHKPSGNATNNLPTSMSVGAGQSVTVDVGSLLSVSDSNLVTGGVRLRYDGSTEGGIQASIMTVMNGESNATTTPFYEPTLTQSASVGPNGITGTQFCGMFETDSSHSSTVFLQNVTNQQVTAYLTLHYGSVSGVNGDYSTGAIVLSPQQHIAASVDSVADAFQGATYGTVEVNAPPRAVVAHTETVTPAGVIKSVATDPTLYTSTSRVLSGMRMDYDSATNCAVMVRNVSFTNTDTVMLKWCTTDGSAAPAPQNVTLAPGTQTLIQWDASEYLSAGASLTGVVMMTYTGSPGDIIADGCCESTTTGFAMPAASVAPNPSDGSHLIGEYFSVDMDTPAELVMTNVSSSTINAGAVLHLANNIAVPLTTDMQAIPANQAISLDLTQYLDGADSTSATGYIDVMYDGAPGSLTVSFMAVGVNTSIGMGGSFGGNAGPIPPLMVFPNTAESDTGDPVQITALTNGQIGAPSWSVTSNTPSPGSVSPGTNPDVMTWPATYNPDAQATLGTDTVTASAGGHTASVTVAKGQNKLTGFSTTQMGADQHERISVEGSSGRLGATTFEITAKRPFPLAGLSNPLIVQFGNDSVNPVMTTVVSAGTNTIGGTAPASTVLGNCRITVFTPDDITVLASSTTLGSYFAYDPPSSVGSIAPAAGFNRLGGTITLSGADFKFQLGALPTVNLSAGGKHAPSLHVDASSVTGTTAIVGNVESAFNKMFPTCQSLGEQPCYFATVRNPGGKAKDAVTGLTAVYTLLPGPPPSNLSLNGNPPFALTGPSVGGTPIDIQGTNLGLTVKVSVGGATAMITNVSSSEVSLIAPLHPAGPAQVTVFDFDGAAPNGTNVTNGSFLYNITVPVKVPSAIGHFCYVGPGEDVVVVGPLAVSPPFGPGSCVSLEAEVKAAIPTGFAQFVPTGAVFRQTDVFCKFTGCPANTDSGQLAVGWSVANSKQMSPTNADELAFTDSLDCKN